MGTVKKISWRSIVFMLLFVLMVGSAGNVKTEAAMKRSKAILLYNNVISKWGVSGKKVKVSTSLHNDKSGVSCRKKGKNVSMKMLHYGQPSFIFKNLGGDSTIEAIFYSPETSNIFVYTIKSGKVKCLGAICCDCYGTGFGAGDFYYNSSKKTFSFLAWPSVRAQVLKTYKISGGKLKCVNTVSRYIGPMTSSGKANIKYYVNNKKKSKTTYNKYYNKYMKKAKRVHWGP